MTGHVWRLWVLAAVIVALLGSGVTAAAVKGPAAARAASPEEPPAETAPPDAWDPRVAPLADWVAAERGLAFQHPVQVDFLTPDEYAEEARRGSTDLSDEEQKEVDRGTGLFRAVGLTSGPSDLAEQSQDIAGEGTAAFYDPGTGRIRVLGTEITVGLRVTVVHELTHVLQDQNFDLSREEGLSDGAALTYRGLAEGDAQRMEVLYFRGLSDDEQKAYLAEAQAQEAGVELGGVSPALVSFFSAPYRLGDQLVGLLDDTDGASAIDEAFRNPPASDESLVDPFTYLAGDGVTSVATPKLNRGEKEFDSSDFGAVSWLVVLGARIDHRVALKAVDGWGGDAYVAFERGDLTCVRAVFVGDTSTDTEEMSAALAQWSAAMPPGTTSVSPVGAGVQMDACDPGPGAELPFTPGYEDILALPATRADAAREFVANGWPQPAARCVGQGIVDRFATQELADREAMVEAPGFDDAMDEIVAGCDTR